MHFMITDCYNLLLVGSDPHRLRPAHRYPFPLKGDKYRNSTVIPYLEAYHYGTQEEDVYFTEHDVNRTYQHQSNAK